jgi:PAS domain S-box-containing protein
MPDRTQIQTDALLNELLDGVFVCSKSGEFVYANPAMEKMLGYSDGRIREKNFAKDIVARELEWQALTSLMDQGSPITDYEIKLKRADGGRAVMAVSATFFRDDSGTSFGIAGVVRDISTRKGVEDDLREKAFRMDIINRIAKAAGASNAIQNTLKGLVDDLRKLVPFEGLSLCATEEKGRHVEILVPNPEDPERARFIGKASFEGSVVEKLKYGKNAVIVEKDLARKPFSEFTLMDISKMNSFLAVPLRSRGRVIGSLNLAHSREGEYSWENADVLQVVADQLAGIIDNMMLLNSLEEKVRLHESLLESGIRLQKAVTTQQIYAAIASHLRDIVPYKDLSFYMVDRQNQVIYPVYAIGGYTDAIMDAPGGIDDGIVGHIARTGKAEFVDDVDDDPRSEQIPGLPPEHDSMLAIPLTGAEGVVSVLELYRDRGQVFSMSDLEAGLLFAQQASVALLNAQVVSKLQDAKKEIELLNDLMFHDISNYNFATMNYLENIVEAGTVSTADRSNLEKALKLMRQNSTLIENVKKLTKIGGMDPSEFTRVDLCDVLTKVTSGLAHSSPDKVISFKLDLPESGGADVMANSLLDELYVNLISNAIKYDPHEEVEVDIKCSKVVTEGHVFWKTTISDRGPGIPDDMKAMLFQKYVRLKPDSTISGTGLGLSIVRALTDKFKGRVWVEDRVPGRSDQGARFCFELPAAKGASK